MKKRVLTFVLVFIILIAGTMPAFGTSGKNEGEDFSDVNRNFWAFEAIQWMFGNNIVEGAGDGKFLPNRIVSRDEFAKMMVLTLKLDLINPSMGSFLDIKKGSWQYQFVETAKPYMTGFRTASGDYFYPSRKAEREDMAVALVKALGLDKESPDLNLLSQFADASSISVNLKKYVAIAVEQGLMKGYDKDGKRFFGPNEGLNRASAAMLLYNAFKQNEEKITYGDDEKITYDNPENASSGLRIKIAGDKAVLNWDKITSTTFSGYKVVISKDDSTPVYPENGYLAYITDRNKTTMDVRAGDCYNGGDIGGTLEAGINYYFSITTLYGDKKVPGNVVRAKLPAVEEEEEDNDLSPAKLRISLRDGKALLSWDKITSSNFQGYKVVISRNDSSPVYPDNGYLQYITDRNNNSIAVKAGDGYNGGDIGGTLKAGVYYYFSITVLYNNGKAAGNVIRAKLPSNGESDEEEQSGHPAANLHVTNYGDKLLLNWDRITSSDFNGYKVVISKYDSSPVYPDNGYMHYITDRNQNRVTVEEGDGYNGGDFDGRLKSGQYYYFSITVLYNDDKVAGNVIRAKVP